MYIIRTLLYIHIIYLYTCIIHTQVVYKDFFNAQTCGNRGNQSALSVSVCIARTCRRRRRQQAIGRGFYFLFVYRVHTRIIVVLIYACVNKNIIYIYMSKKNIQKVIAAYEVSLRTIGSMHVSRAHTGANDDVLWLRAYVYNIQYIIKNYYRLYINIIFLYV